MTLAESALEEMRVFERLGGEYRPLLNLLQNVRRIVKK